MNILRRLPLYRLLLLCGLVLGLGISATALAFALDAGPTPTQKGLAEAVHDALAGPKVEGFSASVKLTNHLLEGASLAGGGQAGELASSPLLAGASGRVWIAKDGRARMELESEKGVTQQVIYDGHTVSLYDASTNTLYEYTPATKAQPAPPASGSHEAPSVAKIEESIAHIKRHAVLSGATPTDIAGQAAYTVRISPKEGGSLLGGAELSFDASNGTPLRAAIYSSSDPSPVIELAATGEVSYGSVSDEVFSFKLPTGVKVVKVSTPSSSSSKTPTSSASKPTITTHGHGLSAIAVVQSSTPAGAKGTTEPMEGLPKVTINGVSATELRTELGTILSFERSGVRYLLAGSVTPSAIEALARGL